MKASPHSEPPIAVPAASTEEASPRIETAAECDVVDLVPRILGIREILVPLDFSEPSEKALRYAVAFARQFDARISVVHVRAFPLYPSDLTGMPMVIPADEPALEQVQARLNTDAQRVIPAAALGHALVRVGAAHSEICEAARECKADLIIIATHGRTGLAHAFLGSTAEQVVRHAPCPVLIVRESEREFA